MRREQRCVACHGLIPDHAHGCSVGIVLRSGHVPGTGPKIPKFPAVTIIAKWNPGREGGSDAGA